MLKFLVILCLPNFLGDVEYILVSDFARVQLYDTDTNTLNEFIKHLMLRSAKTLPGFEMIICPFPRLAHAYNN